MDTIIDKRREYNIDKENVYNIKSIQYTIYNIKSIQNSIQYTIYKRVYNIKNCNMFTYLW